MSIHSALATTDLHVPGYEASADPGAVGAGIYWIDTTGGTGAWVLKVRNAANTGWEKIAAAGSFAEVNTYMDGAGTALDNTWEASVRIPFAGTITESVAGIDPSGSISIDVYRAADGSYGTWTKISASAPIAVSSAIEHKDTTLTGWTTAIAAGDWIRFVVTSAATCTRASVGLKLQRS